MNPKVRALPFPHRLGVLFLALLLVLSVFTPNARAADLDGWEENIVLTGELVGSQFTFTSNADQIFRADNAGPGDVWPGEINVLNKTDDDIIVSLISIESNIRDLALYNALTLDIRVGGELVYEGSYGATPVQITPFYVIPEGETLTLDVTVAFPADCGNEMMGKQMDSTWTFDSRYLGNGPETPGPAMYPYTVEYINAETGKALAEGKKAYGPYGKDVTEYALDIEGYEPDAAEKTITIKAANNKISFFYTKSEKPAEPSPTPSDDPVVEPSDDPKPSEDPKPSDEPSDKPSDDSSDDKPSKDDVQTGNDLRESNTTSAIFILVAVLCALGVVVTFLRILAAKRRTKE